MSRWVGALYKSQVGQRYVVMVKLRGKGCRPRISTAAFPLRATTSPRPALLWLAERISRTWCGEFGKD